MRERYGLAVGWSDHTTDVEAGVIAVALGASVIEKHLTLDKRLPGPDHSASADPDEFSSYVAAIRKTEVMLGTAEKRRVTGEDEVAFAARRSHHATQDLAAGHILRQSDTKLLRPASGAPAWFDLHGRRLLLAVPAGNPIEERFLAPETNSQSVDGDEAVAEGAQACDKR
jgi:N-acetylneuraminate synthase/N,N'-diacetyllegionaminate synthase